MFDAVYTPKITRLLREADECGAKIVTGVEMFIGQAYEQYERFTGLPGKFIWKTSAYIININILGLGPQQMIVVVYLLFTADNNNGMVIKKKYNML